MGNRIMRMAQLIQQRTMRAKLHNQFTGKSENAACKLKFNCALALYVSKIPVNPKCFDVLHHAPISVNLSIRQLFFREHLEFWLNVKNDPHFELKKIKDRSYPTLIVTLKVLK